MPSQETGNCDISQVCVADDNCKDNRENQNEQDSESHNIAIHLANEPNQDIQYSPLPSQETCICDISQVCVADDNCKDNRENQNEQDSEGHNIAIHVANEPNQDMRDSPLPSQETGICDISQVCVADDNCKDKRDNQNEQDSESHNIAIHVAKEPNQDIGYSPLPSQATGICDILQVCVADDNCNDKRDNQNEQDSESHNIAIHVANEPNKDIGDSPLPSQETGIFDISQERVTDDKDKRDNQNEQDSESHNKAIHVMDEPNQDIRVSPLPGQERGICEITGELFNDCTLGKMDISENRDEKSCQYDTNAIQMPNNDGSGMAQNQGEVPHNNIKENCTSISENSSSVDQIQHQSQDNPNVSKANKLHGSSSESIIATSIPPNTKKEEETS